MNDLIEWLGKVLDGDAARLSGPTFCGPVWPTTEQMLARIAADRQILALHVGSHECPGEFGWWGPDTNAGDWCPTARLLALPHAARPGYREEWRP